MTSEEMLERTRKQLLAIVEAPMVDPAHRTQAAAILVKSINTGQQPKLVPATLRNILKEIADA